MGPFLKKRKKRGRVERKLALKLEVWHSTMNQEERHFFLANGGPGYQPHQYVFGYNPKVVKPRIAEKIMALIKKGI